MRSSRLAMFLGFVLLAIYLFATAPQSLAESTSQGRELSTRRASPAEASAMRVGRRMAASSSLSTRFF